MEFYNKYTCDTCVKFNIKDQEKGKWSFVVASFYFF